MPGERLIFGDPPPPVDPRICATLVRGNDAGVLTQDVCGHERDHHQGKGRPCIACPCQGFTTPSSGWRTAETPWGGDR
jgi:hypothetical protein